MENGRLLQVSAERDQKAQTLSLAGELDVSTSAILIEEFARAVGQRPSRIDVDLGKLTYIDSVGLSVLVTAHYQCRDAQIVLEFRRPNIFIKRVLEVTGLAEVLSLASDELEHR
jgi:anti-anti-sigma factor